MTADWPAPVETHNLQGESDVVLLCEHASNHIPSEYGRLGLTPHDLTRHIAWDPGAAEVTRRLSECLKAPAFLGTYSRLLIDLNRPLHTPGSIVNHSEATTIPGNLDLDASEVVRRQTEIFNPFHTTVTEYLDHRQASARPTRLVTIHSFTPVYLDQAREWHGGVLFADAVTLGETLISRLQARGLHVGANVPYKTDRNEDYAVPVHGDDRGIPAVLIEIRNDLIATEAGIDVWVNHLIAALG